MYRAVDTSLRMPLLYRSRPVQAIMTPLSVQYLAGGKIDSISSSAAISIMRWRRYWFEATPPHTTSWLISAPNRSLPHWQARLVLVSS